MAPREAVGKSLVIGVTKFAWMYGMSREWAEGILRAWEQAQQAGTGPIRVFRHGKRRSLYTTLTVIHANFPPGRDLALYRRVEAVEADVADAHRRLDREIIERKRADAELEMRIAATRRRAG
jgi:hypothetical protein